MSYNATSIITKHLEIPKGKNHPFNSQLAMTREAFLESAGVDIFTTRGMGAVLEDPVAYERYQHEMFGDISNETYKNNLIELFDRNRYTVLKGEDITAEDGSTANVTAFSYLNGPVLRAIWSRCIVPALMKVVPLKQTSYTMQFDIPYVIDNNGITRDLPYALVDDDDPIISLHKLVPKHDADPTRIDIDNNDVGSIHFINNTSVGNILSESMAFNPPLNVNDGRQVDRRIFIKDVKYDNREVFDPTGAQTEIETLGLQLMPSDIGNSMAGDIVFKHEWDIRGELVLFVCFIDLPTGRYRATCTNPRIKSFKFEAFLSPEDNRTPITLRQRQGTIQVMVGAGQHIMIDTPVELLQEYPTSHQGTDYVISMNDIASEFFAGSMNIEMINFYKNSFQNTNNSFIPRSVLRGMNVPDAEFSILVAHGENPSAYIDIQLKKCISYWINEVQTYTRIYDGYWSIIGHANNILHIPDFKTEGFGDINGDSNSTRDDVCGFKVQYVFGFTTNIINGKVRCLYTPEIRKDNGLITFFTSTDERRPTALFHPFSYTVSRGYQNVNNALIPSIMITKRHTFQEFLPSQFRLQLLGNDGRQFTTPRTPITPNTPGLTF
jgi:hypothetical protein